MWDENKIRIVDIAEELGVSTATVSNVIHGKTGKTSEATIRRVQNLLQRRGYIPNMAATLLAQNNSRIVGVVVNDHPKYEGHLFEDPFVSAAINALSYELEQTDYFLMLKRTDKIMDAVAYASMWNMDGMILLGFCADDYHRLRDRIRIPFVVFDGFFENDRNICNLTLDNRDGGRQVGAYLKDGHHDAVLCLADNRLLPDYDRYLGLCEGLGQTADLWEIPMERERRMDYYHERQHELCAYTAIFAVSDFYAVEVMYFLIGQGISVPKDISIIGFDDTSLGQIASPALTTVGQDVAHRAKKAVEYLLQMRDDDSFSKTETLPVRLIVRDSSHERTRKK